MKKKVPLTLHIPSPCSQDWSKMPVKRGGRYCDKCTQTIHDFSQMPDKELLQYFTKSPATTCGRFHARQLDRVIQPQKSRWNLPVYVKKMAAAIFAGLSFRNAASQVSKKQETLVAIQSTVKEKFALPESIVISGKVTKGNDVPVANAKVSVDTSVTAYTDVDGKFSITLSGDMITTHNLYFSYDALERTVRTFHPLMGSTSYDVRLMSNEDYNSGRFIMGGIRFNAIDFPSIRFSNRQRYLSNNAKVILNAVAHNLKNDPGVMIQLVSYGGSISDIKNAKRKLELIRNFLINDAGINKERVFIKIEEAGSNDTIDILQYFGD